MLRRTNLTATFKRSFLLRHSPVDCEVVTAATAPMVAHARSAHRYDVSAQGEDIGARNEAAFIAYQPSIPSRLQDKWAMPHYLNLLTITPVWLAIFFGNSVFWGIVAWDFYASSNYEVIEIDYPVK